jgi:hypothetical protein
MSVGRSAGSIPFANIRWSVVCLTQTRDSKLWMGEPRTAEKFL